MPTQSAVQPVRATASVVLPVTPQYPSDPRRDRQKSARLRAILCPPGKLANLAARKVSAHPDRSAHGKPSSVCQFETSLPPIWESPESLAIRGLD